MRTKEYKKELEVLESWYLKISTSYNPSTNLDGQQN